MEGSFDIGSVIAHIKADLSGFTSGIDEAKSEVSSLGDKIGNTLTSVRDFAQQASVFVGIEALAFGKLAQYTLGYAADLEQARIAYDAFTGSADKGKQALTEVTDFARKTPFQLPEVVQAGQMILGFGFSVDDLLPKLKEAGSLAIATKQPMSVAIDLFARAREGIFNLREYGQFGISREALEQFGVSFDKAGSAINKSELLPALEKLINVRFGDVLQKESETLGGTISNIKDDFGRLAATFVGMNAATGEIISGGLFDKVKNVVTAFYNFLEAHMAAVKQIAGNKLLQTAIEGIALAIGSLVVIIPIVIAVLNPVVLAVIAIEAAIAALYIAWNTNFLGIRDITSSVISQMTIFWDTYLKPAIVVLVAFFKSHWDTISLILKGAWDFIVGVVQVAWAIVYGIITIGLAILSGNWSNVWKAINDMTTNWWGGMQKIFTGIVEFIAGWGGTLFHELVKPFEDAWSAIQNLINKIKDGLDFTKRHSPSIVDIVENGVAKVNEALGGLAFNNTLDVNPKMAFAGIGNNGPISSNEIHIHLDGAVIADSASATRIGEVIGDSIIKKLQLNIRI